MNSDFWIFLLLHLAWCAVVFCHGTLFGLWIADWHYWKANHKRDDEEDGK